MSSVANSRFLQCFIQCSPCQDIRQRLSIGRATVNVRAWVDVGGDFAGRFVEYIRRRFFADENFLDPTLSPRFVADARQSNARVGNLILCERQRRGDADDGEVAEAPRKLDKRRAGTCRY